MLLGMSSIAVRTLFYCSIPNCFYESRNLLTLIQSLFYTLFLLKQIK